MRRSSERLLKSREFCETVGIRYSTLKQWVREGRVRVLRTSTGRWRIPYSEVERILGLGRAGAEVRAVIYARVSSEDRKLNLEGQVKYLTKYCSAKGYSVVDVLSDIASDLNTSRGGLLKLLNYVANKQVDVVVVTYKDRLARLGLEYLEQFFKGFGVKIEAVYGEEAGDSYQELVEDLIEIVTSFAGKLYSVGSHREKRLVEGFKELLEEVERSG